MLPEFPMKSFFNAAILSLGLLSGIISTGTAQNFDAMSFGGAGDFGTPQASGTARATVESYAAKPFVVVTELALPDHWHVYYKNPGSVGMPLEASMKETPGFRIEGPFCDSGTGQGNRGLLRLQQARRKWPSALPRKTMPRNRHHSPPP